MMKSKRSFWETRQHPALIASAGCAFQFSVAELEAGRKILGHAATNFTFVIFAPSWCDTVDVCA
jgi:hypothetical protein